MTVKSDGSTLQIMRTLLAKDWRVYRVPVIGLLVVSVGCYLVLLVGTMYRWSEHDRPSDSFIAAGIIAANLTALLASVFGGVAIAGERGDRTADFMAMLPVTRWQIVCSKWVVSFVAVIAFGAVNGIVVFFLKNLSDVAEWRLGNREPAASDAAALALWAGCAICFFGTAWLLSVSIKSAAISACIAIASTACFAAFVAICIDGDRQNGWQLPSTIGGILAAIGLASLVSGTIYYLRRIAP